MNRYLAIVPALNEVQAISATIAEIRRRGAPEFDILVVDDGSTDGTAAAAITTGANVLRLPFNLGIGGAVQTGYVYAHENGYEIAIQVDGDGQHDARQIPDLVAHMDAHPEFDMVVGFQVRLDPDGEGFRSSASRRVGIRIFAALLSRITAQPVTDPTSGFRLTNRTGIRLFAAEYPHDYPEVEALLLIHGHRLRSCEIPVRMRPRTSGASAISSIQAAYYMTKVLLAVFVGLFRSHPTLEPGDQPVSAQSAI